MRIPSGIFGHCKIDKILTMCPFAYLKNLTVFNLERGADFDRSRLVHFFRISIEKPQQKAKLWRNFNEVDANCLYSLK